jgi:sphingosine kinase
MSSSASSIVVGKLSVSGGKGKKGVFSEHQLTSVSLFSSQSPQEPVLLLADTVGFTADEAALTLTLHTYPFAKPADAKTLDRPRKYVAVAVVTAQEQFAVWREAFRGLLAVEPRRRLIVLVNPVSGRKKGAEMWDECRAVLARVDGLDLDVIVTKDEKTGPDTIRDLELDKYDGLVCVSGDGLLHECMQGLRARPDAGAAFPRLTFGIVAAGTANALATTLNALHPLNAAVHIAKGSKQALDLWDVRLPGLPAKVGFCIFTWGLMSSATKDAEKYRWMGGPRYKFSAALEMFRNQTHKVVVEYVPAPSQDMFPCPHGRCQHCSLPLPPSTPIAPTAVAVGDAPAFQDSDWVRLEEGLEIVLATNLTHIAYDLYSSPFAHFADGAVDLQLVKPLGFFANVGMMGKIKTGAHLEDKEHVRYIKARALRITPVDKGIPYNLDGEIFPSEGDPALLTVLPAAAHIFHSP